MLKRVLFTCAATLALAGCVNKAQDKCTKDPSLAECQPPPPVCAADACCPAKGQICDLTPAAQGIIPLDATLSPDGKVAYAIGIGANGPTVFKNSAPSTATPTILAEGDPMSGPTSIDITSDGKTLIIADPAALLVDDDRGEIFSLSASGGTVSALSGPGGYRPRGLVVVSENVGGNDIDVIYFSGFDKADGVPGLFKVPAAGGTVETVAKGDPMVDPSGVAVTAAKDVFTLDTQDQIADTANLIKVVGGKPTVILPNLKVGYPAGIALSSDDSTLIISALDSETGTDVVLRYDLATAKVTESVSTGIDTFTESAGLHRAKGVNAYAWADSKANGGTVYVVNKQQ